MKQYLIDTNILIHILAGDVPDKTQEFLEEICSYPFYLSIISKIELLGWRGTTPDGLILARELIKESTIIPLTDSIADIAISLRRSHAIKLPDAVIAATAMDSDLMLVTRNIKDFRDIEGLSVINPFQCPEESGNCSV